MQDLKKIELIIRQQPVHSRMCGFGEKVDRRPIDPPPVVQIKMENDNTKALAFNLFLVAVLVPADDQEQNLNILRHSQLTVGRTVSSLYHLRDLDGTEAAFFVFSDISVRTEGNYRLKMCLFDIVSDEICFKTSILTEPFTVYSAKAFPGMYRTCPLVRLFAQQGLKIRVRSESGPRSKNTQSPRKVVPKIATHNNYTTSKESQPTIMNDTLDNETTLKHNSKRLSNDYRDNIPCKRRLSLSYLLDQNEKSLTSINNHK